MALPTSYATTFPATENPISEGSSWTNGFTNGLDWTDVRTTTNEAFATQNPTLHGFDDSIAVRQGTFGADQIATATVVSTLTSGDYDAEVELLLRFSISAHSAQGYEINFNCNPNSSHRYITIVRWNGALNDFTNVTSVTGTADGLVVAGDVIRASIIGSTITVYKNGVQVLQGTDSTYTTGNPGIGFFANNGTNTVDPSLYGFSSFASQTYAPVGSQVTANPVLRPRGVPVDYSYIGRRFRGLAAVRLTSFAVEVIYNAAPSLRLTGMAREIITKPYTVGEQWTQFVPQMPLRTFPYSFVEGTPTPLIDMLMTYPIGQAMYALPRTDPNRKLDYSFIGPSLALQGTLYVYPIGAAVYALPRTDPNRKLDYSFIGPVPHPLYAPPYIPPAMGPELFQVVIVL